MGYFSERAIDNPPAWMRPRLPAQADAYLRAGRPVCVPCSDSEDRDFPIRPRGDALCSICGERIDGR